MRVHHPSRDTYHEAGTTRILLESSLGHGCLLRRNRRGLLVLAISG